MGGEAQKLTEAIQDVNDFAWSPDSKRLVLVLQDPSPEELEEAKTKKKTREEPRQGQRREGEEAERLRGRWWWTAIRFKTDTIGYLERRRTHFMCSMWPPRRWRRLPPATSMTRSRLGRPTANCWRSAATAPRPDPDRTYDTNIWVVAADNTDKGAHLTQVTTNPGRGRAAGVVARR